MTAAAPRRQRLEDWPERLVALLHASLGRPFVLGQHDCGRFACAAAVAVTGRDPAPWLTAATYATEDELAALLAPHGGLEAAAAAAMADFGAAEIPPALAQRGDWLLLEVGNEMLLGIVAGDRAAAAGLGGLRYAPIGRCARRAWAL